MAYKIDGSSHHSGIKNEKYLKEYLQNGAAKKLYKLGKGYKVHKRGGTQYKQDLEITDGKKNPILISVKKKEKTGTGSFDWVNSTKALSGIPVLTKFAARVKEIGEKETRYGQAKINRQQASYDCLNSLTSKDLKKILKEHVLDKNKQMRVMIRDLSADTVWEYKFIDMPLCKSIKNDTPFLSMGKGIDSAAILFRKKNGTVVDHKIRIRVIDNNGIGALIGQSTANKSSIACIKIQQDDVAGLIKSLGKKIRSF